MIHRALIATLAAGLAAGLLSIDAEAGHRFKNHWFYSYDGNPPPRYSRYYRNYEDISPEEYEQLYGDDLDEAYYDPYYEPPVRKLKPAKKKAVKSQPAPTARKKATPLKTAAPSVEKPKITVPAAEKPKPQSTASLSCDKAGAIISGYGFSAIKASDCTGQVYAFDAARDGKSYAIKLNAASGELTEVRKVR